MNDTQRKRMEMFLVQKTQVGKDLGNRLLLIILLLYKWINPFTAVNAYL